MNRLMVTLVVISILASGGLGWAVYDQGQRLRQAEATLDAKVEDAEDRLADALAAAIEEVPDVDAVKRDLDALESTLFGFSGSGFQKNVIGGLKTDVSAVDRSVTSLMFDLSTFKSCMNRALSNSFDSYERASNSYFGGGVYYVSKCY